MDQVLDYECHKASSMINAKKLRLGEAGAGVGAGTNLGAGDSSSPVANAKAATSSNDTECEYFDEFNFPVTDSAPYAKTSAGPIGGPNLNSINEIMKGISIEKQGRLDRLGTGEFCPVHKLTKLIGKKERIKGSFGTVVHGEIYLLPEEALYLVEVGELQILIDNIPISIEKARILLLNSSAFPPPIPPLLRTCSTLEYAAYKHLLKMGYVLRRRLDEDYFTTDTNSTGTATTMDPEEAEAELQFQSQMDVDSHSATASTEKLEQMSPNRLSDFADLLPPETDITFVNEHQSSSKRGTKRKAPTSFLMHDLIQDDLSSDGSITIVDEERKPTPVIQLGDGDSDCEIQIIHETSGTVPPPTGPPHLEPQVNYDQMFDDFGLLGELRTPPLLQQESELDDFVMDADEIGSEPVPGPSWRTGEYFSSTTSSTTITSNAVIEEAPDSDSDVEIVEEVMHSYSGVGIEEICLEDFGSLGARGFNDSGSSGEDSSPPRAIVQFASSDSETEDEFDDIDKNIWSKFVPNSGTIHLSFPPSYLLPQNIQPRNDHEYYPFTFGNTNKDKNSSNSSGNAELDIELESIVDSLSLDSNTRQPTPCSSWKEWRNLAMNEARDVLNDSLLGSKFSTEKSKLYQWKTNSNPSPPIPRKKLSIIYDLYSSTTTNVNRKRFGTEVKPLFGVTVVKSQEIIPDISNLPKSPGDSPLVIAVVSDESEVTTITLSGDPVPFLIKED